MESKEFTRNVSYHIESKPGGGLIARPTDPQMETIEGATMDDVLRQINAKLPFDLSQFQQSGMQSEVGSAHSYSVKGTGENSKDVSYRIQAKTGGGFVANLNDPAIAPIEGTTFEEVHQKAMAQARAAVGLQGLGDMLHGPGDMKSATYTFVQSASGKEIEITDKETVRQLLQANGLPVTPNSQNSQFFRVILGLLFLGLLLYLLIWRK